MAETLVELVARITADSTELKKALNQSDAAIDSFAAKTKTSFKMIGGAFTAVGVAGMAMVSSSLKINAALSQTAMTVGSTTKEMRDLALKVTGVSSPLSDVTATFELLAKAGIKSNESMGMAFRAFDALGDATGSTAATIADTLIPVFRAFGQELPTTSGELDKFTWLSKNTTVSISAFATVVQRLAPEMQAMGLSTADAMIAIAGLEAKGITGRKATMELGTAIGAAAKSGKTLFDELGFTTEEVTKYQAAMDGAAGITDKYAEAAEKQFSIMDKVKQAWSEIVLKSSGFLEPLEPLLAGTTALGSVMMALSTSLATSTLKMIAHTGAIIAHTVALVAARVAVVAATVAQWAWNVAMTANPIGIIILAIVALIAAIILIARNWDVIRETTIKVWNTIIGFLKGAWDTIVGFFRDNWALILAILFPAVGLPILIAQNWGAIVEVVSNIWNNVVNIVKSAWDNVVSFVLGGVNSLIGGINSVIQLINKVPGINIGTIGKIGVPQLASGGIVTQPTLAMIGESGAEAVIPLSEMSDRAIQNNIYMDGALFAQIVSKYFDREYRAQLT